MPALRGILWIAVLVCLVSNTARAGSLDQWTIRPSGTGANLYDVVYGAGKFVIVGQNHTILLSTNNGATWNAVSNTLTNSLNGVAWGTNRFVTVGDNASIATSPDAVTWTQQNSPVTTHLRAVRFLNGSFFAVGGAGKIVTSTDGISWTERSSGTIHTLEGIAFGNGTFCAVGGTNSNPNSFLRSSDGIAWSNFSSNNLYLYDVTFGNGIFVAQGVRGIVHTSTNAFQWTSRQVGNGDYVIGCTFGQGRFVAVGGPFGGGGQKIVSSMDGMNWTLHSVNAMHSGRLESVAYGNGYFVAVGQKGLILQSDAIFTIGAGKLLRGGGMQWTLTGEVGRSYLIQSAPDLAVTNWSTITNLISTEETTVLSTPASASPAEFYRVISP